MGDITVWTAGGSDLVWSIGLFLNLAGQRHDADLLTIVPMSGRQQIEGGLW